MLLPLERDCFDICKVGKKIFELKIIVITYHWLCFSAPKSSKSWSKIRSAHCTSLTDPVLPVSSNKIYSKINETPQIHLEAYNVLLDSSSNLKTTIREYKHLLQQREEMIDSYDTIIVKHNEYDSTKVSENIFYLSEYL